MMGSFTDDLLDLYKRVTTFFLQILDSFTVVVYIQYFKFVFKRPIVLKVKNLLKQLRDCILLKLTGEREKRLEH